MTPLFALSDSATAVIAIIAAIVAAIPPTLLALATFIKSIRVGEELRQLDVKVDGRLTQLLEITRDKAHADGVLSGQTESTVVIRRVIEPPKVEPPREGP